MNSFVNLPGRETPVLLFPKNRCKENKISGIIILRQVRFVKIINFVPSFKPNYN